MHDNTTNGFKRWLSLPICQECPPLLRQSRFINIKQVGKEEEEEEELYRKGRWSKEREGVENSGAKLWRTIVQFSPQFPDITLSS